MHGTETQQRYYNNDMPNMQSMYFSPSFSLLIQMLSSLYWGTLLGCTSNHSLCVWCRYLVWCGLYWSLQGIARFSILWPAPTICSIGQWNMFCCIDSSAHGSYTWLFRKKTCLVSRQRLFVLHFICAQDVKRPWSDVKHTVCSYFLLYRVICNRWVLSLVFKLMQGRHPQCETQYCWQPRNCLVSFCTNSCEEWLATNSNQ